MSFKCGFFVWHFFCLKGQHEKLQNLFFLEKFSSSLSWPDSNNTFEENRNLGNFSNSQVFGKFLGFPNFYRNLRVVYFQDFGNFSNDWIFHRFLGILGNLTDSQAFEEFSRFQDISRFLKESEGVLFFNYREPGNFPN